MSGDDNQWWWSLRLGRVEHGPGEPNAERLGPYATEAEAAGALERARARNEAWEHDPTWSDDED